MLQKHPLTTLIAICAILALQLPAVAQIERNPGSRSRSNPGRNRAVGQDVSENPDASVLFSMPPVEEVEIGFLGTTLLAKDIAQSMMQLAGLVTQLTAPVKEELPNFIIEVEPQLAIDPKPVEQPEPAAKPEPEPTQLEPKNAPVLEPVVEPLPSPRPTRVTDIPAPPVEPTPPVDEPEPVEPEPAETIPVEPDSAPVGLVDQLIENTSSDISEVEIPGTIPVKEGQGDSAVPMEDETPSRFAVRKSEVTEAAKSALDASMVELSELMAKLEKLDPPTDEQANVDVGRVHWRTENERGEGNPNLEMNSSEGVAFRQPGDEALQSPGQGTKVDYPDNPNTNLLDNEIAKLTPSNRAGGQGQDNPRLFAMAALRTSPNFEQALVFSPLSRIGLGAITTSVRALDPANMAFLRTAPSMPSPRVSALVRSLSRGNPKQLKIALTFDDGPHPEFTNKILAILDYYDVKATFFYVGLQANRYPEWIKMTNQAGHEIASQTYDHFRMPKLPLEEKQYQIDKYQRLIENIVGVTPRFMRPPGGKLDEVTKRLIIERGMVLGLWDVALNDTREGKTAAEMLKTAKSQVRPGSVLLVHDGIQATIEVLPELIEFLSSQGYQFVTMSELAQGL